MSFAARQAATSGLWSGSAIAVLYSNAPFVIVYPWGNSFGSKYSDPSSLIGSAALKAAFSPSGDALVIAHQNSPYVSAYAWDAGFGTKYSNPSILPPATANDVAFNSAGTVVAVAHNGSPYISVYAWNSATGFGTKYADPATLPTGNASGVAFSAGGGDLAVAHANSPYVTAYAFSSGPGFIAKYSDPATLPAGDAFGVAFRTIFGGSTELAVAHTNSPYVSVYAWPMGGGFGSKFADPAVLPSDTGTSVSWEPNGTGIAVGSAATPPFLASSVSVYSWSYGFVSKYANPGVPFPNGTTFDVGFSSDGTALAAAVSAPPYVVAYRWSPFGFGGRYADPSTQPTSTAFGVAWKA